LETVVRVNLSSDNGDLTTNSEACEGDDTTHECSPEVSFVQSNFVNTGIGFNELGDGIFLVSEGLDCAYVSHSLLSECVTLGFSGLEFHHYLTVFPVVAWDHKGSWDDQKDSADRADPRDVGHNDNNNDRHSS